MSVQFTVPKQRGVELGYAQITTSATSTTLNSNVADDTGDVSGLSVTVTVGTRPIVIRAWASRFFCDTTTSAAIAVLMEGDTTLSFARYDQHASASEGVPMVIESRLAPSAGSHTYKVTLTVLSAATATIAAAATAPAFIQVVEV